MLQSAVWIAVVAATLNTEWWVVCLQLREQLHHQARELGGGGLGRVCHRVWFEGPVKSFLIRVGWGGGGAAPVRPAGPRPDGSDGAPSAGTRSLSGEFVAQPKRGRAATVVAKRRRLRLPHVQLPPLSRWLHRHPQRPQRRPALLVLQQVPRALLVAAR